MTPTPNCRTVDGGTAGPSDRLTGASAPRSSTSGAPARPARPRPERCDRRLGEIRARARAQAEAQLALAGGGFDHTWVLRPAPTGLLRHAALLHHPASGRLLECLTTEPGVQVYTAGGFDGAVVGHSGRTYGAFAGIALETQHFPDSPHHPAFPSTVLRPGQEHRSTTVYRLALER
jgi:galactose mutarotase-like enzyme